MKAITFSYEHALYIQDKHLNKIESSVKSAHEMLHHKTGHGNNSLGWLKWPETITTDEISHIKSAATQIKNHSDILLVVGVGGSYLGARAAIEMLSHSFNHLLNDDKRSHPIVLYVGHNLSSTYISELIELLKNKDFSVNVISKSGTTMEPAIAFRLFENLLIEKYGKENLADRIFVTTSEHGGALKEIALENNYRTFHIPENIGGRYSVLTAVGLLPMAVGGIDIEKIIAGATEAMEDLSTDDLMKNSAYQYAASRYLLYEQGKLIELLVSYEPHLHYFSEWWKQLFAESEGKQQHGIFPTAAKFTTDLHSLGQYIQDGRRHLFETILHIHQAKHSLNIPKRANDLDGLNFLADRSVENINGHALKGALQAHTTGNVPNLIINIPQLNAYYTGYLFYFFQKACAISGYLQDINPFDQPGVELYKTNMQALLKE